MPARELKTISGQTVELTTAEFNLLELFVRRPVRVHTRDALMDGLKGHDWTPLDRTIDSLVSRLRKKIEADPENPSLIKTVRGVGYVFVSPVTRVVKGAVLTLRAPSGSLWRAPYGCMACAESGDQESRPPATPPPRQ